MEKRQKKPDPVFVEKATEMNAPIVFAEDNTLVLNANSQSNMLIYETQEYPRLEGELGGCYQIKNTNTILHALKELKALGYRIEEQSVRNGFSHVNELTGLMGRWQKLSDAPLLICDTGHNIGRNYVYHPTNKIDPLPPSAHCNRYGK